MGTPQALLAPPLPLLLTPETEFVLSVPPKGTTPRVDEDFAACWRCEYVAKLSGSLRDVSR